MYQAEHIINVQLQEGRFANQILGVKGLRGFEGIQFKKKPECSNIVLFFLHTGDMEWGRGVLSII